MRKFEMYLVFILSATLLSVRGDDVKEKFRKALLKLHNDERTSNDAILELETAPDDVKQSMYEFIKEKKKDDIRCFKSDICCIVVKINQDVLSITAEKALNALKSVHGEVESRVTFAKNMMNKAIVADFFVLQVDKEKWLIAAYYPGGYPNAEKKMVNKGEDVGNDVNLFPKIELKQE